ncbi:MAG: serine/threonine protein kinase [Polyangiaceae bacterium]|nr:serine/threonine protein kinase [Polyangiaceae bacterium]
MISAATLRHDAFKAPAPTRALFPEFPPVDWADGDTVLNATPSKSGEMDIWGAIRPGSRIEGTPYVAVRPIGQGGMGDVFEVEHTALGKHFALKMLRPSHLRRPDLAARMRDEARTLAALRHPNLVEVFDLGSTPDGRVYFTMEMLAGRDLRRELRRLGSLSVPAALNLVAQALDGLQAAHEAGIVHRDIKLDNLFLCDDGSLKILDFGIAKQARRRSSVTGHGVLGTARTMAPEQHASGSVDARTDIYAAGLVLYELVAGRGPFDEVRGQEQAMRFAHCERRPPPPSTFAPQEVPAPVEEAILKAIEKRPERRFQSAAEMAATLRDCLADASKNAVKMPSPTLVSPPGIDAALWPRRLLHRATGALDSIRGRIFPLRLNVP